MDIQFGCAPINWTNDDLPSLGGELTYQQCLSEMALAGYTGSEGGNKYPKDFDTLKKALDIRGIKICNMWFSSMLTRLEEDKNFPFNQYLENNKNQEINKNLGNNKNFDNNKYFEDFNKHLDFTYALGARIVGVGECGVTIHGQESIPLFSNLPYLTDEQFENLAMGLNEMGRMANAKGMSLCFHPHVGTGIQTSAEIDCLMSLTDPKLVYLLFDTGHLTLAGEEPVAILRKYISRVRHIHFKDVRSDIYKKFKTYNWSFLNGVKEGIFTVPGDGDLVKWDDLFEILKVDNYSGWIVIEAEQDPSKADPLEYAIIARKFLRENLGK